MIPFPFNLRCRRLRWNKFQKIWSAAKLNGEGGFPHSEIVGSKLAHSSPTLIAACHVLHRLCMPRHSPNALTSHLRVHTTNDKPDRSEDRQDCANDADDCFHSQPVLINALIVMTFKSRRTASLQPIEPARHRLKNPFTMSKCR